jgi:hypothetical protein
VFDDPSFLIAAPAFLRLTYLVAAAAVLGIDVGDFFEDPRAPVVIIKLLAWIRGRAGRRHDWDLLHGIGFEDTLTQIATAAGRWPHAVTKAKLPLLSNVALEKTDSI